MAPTLYEVLTKIFQEVVRRQIIAHTKDRVEDREEEEDTDDEYN